MIAPFIVHDPVVGYIHGGCDGKMRRWHTAPDHTQWQCIKCGFYAKLLDDERGIPTQWVVSHEHPNP